MGVLAGMAVNRQGGDQVMGTKGKWIIEVWFATSRNPRDIGWADTHEAAIREARQYLSDARRVRVIAPDGKPEWVSKEAK